MLSAMPPRRPRACPGARLAVACAFALAAGLAHAGIEAFAIEQVYSNADGSVQFVVLRDTQNQDHADAWFGGTLAATQGGATTTFTFPGDLPGAGTAGRRVLLGSAGFAALGLVAADYVLPDRFVPTAGGTLAIGGGDALALGALPADGVTALSAAARRCRTRRPTSRVPPPPSPPAR